MTGLRVNDDALYTPSFLIYRISLSPFLFLFVCFIVFFSPWINVCSGLDLTKYLAYLSLCTMSSHFPYISPSHPIR